MEKKPLNEGFTRGQEKAGVDKQKPTENVRPSAPPPPPKKKKEP